MAIQAYEYEKEYKIDLQEFFEDLEISINDKYIKELAQELERLRK